MDAPFNTLDVLPLILNQKYHLDRYNYNIDAHSYHLCCLVIQVPIKRNYQYILRQSFFVIEIALLLLHTVW